MAKRGGVKKISSSAYGEWGGKKEEYAGDRNKIS